MDRFIKPIDLVHKKPSFHGQNTQTSLSIHEKHHFHGQRIHKRVRAISKCLMTYKEKG